MKTKLAIGLFVLVLTVMPLATSALTADDVQAKIRDLLAKVAELTAQIRALQGQVGTDAVITTITDAVANAGFRHRVCALLERNLSVGMTGDDVRSLQEFLRTEGYLSAQATGYFGELTRDALMRWQASEGVVSSGSAQATGWGLLGPRTRERIKAWCGGWVNKERFSATPTQGAAPLTVTFNTWVSAFQPQSVSYAIDYGDGTSEPASLCNAPADAGQSPGQNTHTYTANGIYTATLKKTNDPCMGNPMCMAPVSLEVVGKVQIYVGMTPACTKEYMPVCGAKPIVCITTPCNPVPTTYSNRCMMEADGASFLYEGQCRTQSGDPSADPQCRQWFDGCNTCSRSAPGGIAACTLRYCPSGNTGAYCIAYFGDPSTNKPPTISGFSGPTTLRVNETGTWTVRASDPEGRELSYYISWGDEAQYTASGLMTSLPVFTQTTTFTHVYSVPGTYTVMIIARDAAGTEARVSITVRVTSDTVACTLQYDPICGRPPGCANTCAPGAYCAADCLLHTPITYSNRCFLDAAGASIIHDDVCTTADR